MRVPAPATIAQRDETVLEMLLRGIGKSAIGKDIGLVPSQVTQSIRRSFAKLGVKNLIELGAWASRNGRMQDER